MNNFYFEILFRNFNDKYKKQVLFNQNLIIETKI